MGFDVIQLNLHKTFSTPHGGGGPGAARWAYAPSWLNFCPCPASCARDRNYYWSDNFPTASAAWRLLRQLQCTRQSLCLHPIAGRGGTHRVSEMAVLNANYINEKLKAHYDLPYDRTCMHECVFSAKRQVAEDGVHAIDIAKGLIDPAIIRRRFISRSLFRKPS